MSDNNVIYFLYFDDAYSNGIIRNCNKNLRVLKPDEDQDSSEKQDCNATFRLENMPHNIIPSFAEFQERHGKIICIIDQSIGTKLTEEQKKYLHHLKKVGNNSYHLVTGYGITLKNTDLKLTNGKISASESNLTDDVYMRVVRVNKLKKNGKSNDFYILKFQGSDTVTLSKAPDFIRTTLHQYEKKHKCILVRPIDDSYSGDSDIIELRKSKDPSRYNYTKVCKESEGPVKKKFRY